MPLAETLFMVIYCIMPILKESEHRKQYVFSIKPCANYKSF